MKEPLWIRSANIVKYNSLYVVKKLITRETLIGNPIIYEQGMDHTVIDKKTPVPSKGMPCTYWEYLIFPTGEGCIIKEPSIGKEYIMKEPLQIMSALYTNVIKTLSLHRRQN